MLKAIIFNIDGVITNLSAFNFMAWKSVFSFQGVNLTKQKWKRYAHKSRLNIAHEIFKDHHIAAPIERIKEVANQKNELFMRLIKSSLTPKNLYNGILTIVEQARTRNIKLIVISNSSNAILEMQCLGLYKKFDNIFHLQHSSTKNEDDDTDQQLMKLLNKSNLKPDECIGIEDDINDLKRYKRLGIFAVGITNFDDLIKKETDYWVSLPEQINFEEIIFAYYKKERPEI